MGAEQSGIVVHDLVRTYVTNGAARQALRGITFEAPRGQISALLGPNGAGKTTCVKILTTLLAPTSGRIRIDGIDLIRNPKDVQRRVGVSFGGETGLYGRLSALDNLRFFGTMYGMHGRRLRRRAEELLAAVDLTDRAGDRVETYSRGMRQRLHIARTLMHDPPVVLLDEPSSGMAPENARALRTLVKTLAAEGRTVLLTSHNLAEVESVCDQILILIDGKIVRSTTSEKLRNEAAHSLGTVIEFQVRRELPDSFLAEFPGMQHWSRQDRSWRVRCSDATAGVAFVLNRAEGNIAGLQINPPTLEDAYLEVVGENGDRRGESTI